MSVNPVSQSNAAITALSVQNQAPHKTQAAAPAPQDTVQLSSQAKAAATGDVDHDGDSH